MKKMIAVAVLLLVITSLAQAQSSGQLYRAEVYAFYGRRTGTPGTSIGGAGAEGFIYKGIAAGAEIGMTIGNPDDRITIGSIDAFYHFFCCRANRRVEPFAGYGYSSLWGSINTHGYYFPFNPGQDRYGPNFSQGLTVWATKSVGARFELREYRMFVSYGALENVIPGGNPVEFHIGVTFR